MTSCSDFSRYIFEIWHAYLPTIILSHIFRFFRKDDFFRKKYKRKFFVVYFYNFQNFENSKFRDSSLIARIILSRLAKTDRLYLQTCMCYGVSANPYFWPESTKHDVTLTSLAAILSYSQCFPFDTMRKIDVQEGTESFATIDALVYEILRKNLRGG